MRDESGSATGALEQRLNPLFELRWDHRIGITEGTETLVRSDQGCI
jgi:hypothetical protein